MANTVRAALLQTDWPGTKDEMLDKHEQAACDQIAHVLANLREQRTPGVLRERERQPLRADCAWPLLPGFLRAFSRQRRHPTKL